MRIFLIVGVVGAAAAIAVSAPAARPQPRQNPATAALQVALRAKKAYSGSVDGISGPATVAALRRFQRKAGLSPTGIADARTRAALGALGKPLAGRRTIGVGSHGWDVAVVEFELARHGFDPGRIDGRFDLATLAAMERFRSSVGLPYHCLVEPSTQNTLKTARTPHARVHLDAPVKGRVARGFGIVGNHLHGGVDISAPYGTGIAAAAAGRVVAAGQFGPLGLAVRVAHRHGVESIYGHLARIDVSVGQQVVRGAWLGLVGRTGNVAKPKLYFEVRVHGAAVDPLSFVS